MTEKKKPSRHRAVWGFVVLLALVAAIVAYLVIQAMSGAKTTTSYVTSAARNGTLTVTVSASGNARVVRSASVDPGVSGVVTDLKVGLGSQVKSGDMLFEVENDSLDVSVQKALAAYDQQDAQVDRAYQQQVQAKNTLDDLKSKPDATDAQIAEAEANLEAAESSYKSAKANRESSYLDYQQALETADKRTVTAPIAGYVTALNVQDGDQLGSTSAARSTGTDAASTSNSQPSAPIVISDLSKLEASLQIAESDRPKVKIGQKVTLTVDAVPDLTLTGKVTSIDAVGTSSQNVVTYGVVVAFDIQDPKVSPGMTLAGSIVADVRPDVLLVPNTAVKSGTDGYYVQVLSDPQGTPEDRTVEIGGASDSQTEIVSGLKAGEQVVTQTTTANSTSTSSQRAGGFRVFGGAGGGPRD